MDKNYINTLFVEKTRRIKDLSVLLDNIIGKLNNFRRKGENVDMNSNLMEEIKAVRGKLHTLTDSEDEKLTIEGWAERLAETIDVIYSAFQVIDTLVFAIPLESAARAKPDHETLEAIVTSVLSMMWRVKCIHYSKGETSPTSAKELPLVYSEDVDMSLADYLQEITWQVGWACQESEQARYEIRDMCWALGINPAHAYDFSDKKREK